MPDQPTKPEPKPKAEPKKAPAFSEARKQEARERAYPTRPDVTCELEEGVTVIVYRDNQGRELTVERYSPNAFASE